jgi:hypothetical protein
MGSTLLIVVLVALPVLALGAYLFVRSRQPRQAQVSFKYFQCPHCKQRLRYQQKQAGHPGQCPRCKRSITFPR